MVKTKVVCTVGSVFALGAAAVAQQGSIRGVVTDKDFKVPLSGVEVRIAETNATTATSDQGIFEFPALPARPYTLVFSKSGYQRQVPPAVVVSAGGVEDVSIEMSGEFTEMDELVVQDLLRLGGGGEAALLQLRFESPSLLDSISSDLMSRAGASDAAGALRLVTGATVRDGKFAVVRGLPDRYVVAKVNGVRLPSADEETRAVELDQFPSVVIETIQVSKTFTPDQQGDASGGAVDVRLKDIPDKPFFFEFKAQTGFNTNVGTTGRFLSYDGGGITASGQDSGRRRIQTERIGANWTGAAGVNETAPPNEYKWTLATGGRHEFDNGLTVGFVSSYVYDRDTSFRDDGVDESFWITQPGRELEPRTLQGTPEDGDFRTQIFDVRRGRQSLQLGGLIAGGIEYEGHSVTATYLRTRTSQDTATLAIDTRAKSDYFFPFFPGYDPNDPRGIGNEPDNLLAAPYVRNETLEYEERQIETLTFRGEHTIPIGEVDLGGNWKLLEPTLDWTFAESSAQLDQPDKRQFGAIWLPASFNPGVPGTIDPFTTEPTWFPFKPAANFNLGNFQRIFLEIEEDSVQHIADLKLPFEQWDGHRGYLQVGMFDDQVDRRFNQDTFSNFGDAAAFFEGDFDQPWSAAFPFEDHPITESDFDVDYRGEQDISAYYAMMDMPLASNFNLIGGVRFESTDINIVNEPEASATWFPPGATAPVALNPGDADVEFSSDDVLPSLGLLYEPHDKVTIRLGYAETLARQTFRELTPIIQQEFLGGPIFIGNPELTTASLKNYDIRIDYRPIDGSLISASYFYKDIDDAIEFVQRLAGFDFTFPVNYPSGELKGWEFEARTGLGFLSEYLAGFTIGGNATLIDSSVDLPQEEIDRFAAPAIASPRTSRDATGAPEHLFNANLTYDWQETGTKAGLFYTVTGDTLVAGAGEADGNLVPDVYAKEFDSLNFTLNQRLSDWAGVTFQAKNITNPLIETEYRPLRAQARRRASFTRGTDFSISIGGEITF